MLIVAVILGIITVFFARSIIENNRVNQAVVTAPAENIETTTIVIATAPLKFGDELTVDNLREVEWPENLKPDGSFENVEEIIGTQRRVVLRSISDNEPIVKNKISGFGYRASLSQIIGKDNRAVTIRVNDVVGVGGFVLPGDEVDVILSYQDGDDILDMISKNIIQNVRVLAIDQISDEAQEGAIVGKAATIEVTPEQAQKIAVAAKIGTLSLALRKFSEGQEQEQIATEIIDVSDLEPSGADVKKPTPVRTRTTTSSRTVKPKVPSVTSMLITRGTDQTEEKVTRETEGALVGGSYPGMGTDLGGAQLTRSVNEGVGTTREILFGSDDN